MMQQIVWRIIFDGYTNITEVVLIFVPVYNIGQARWPIMRKLVFLTPFALQYGEQFQTNTVVSILYSALRSHRHIFYPIISFLM